MEFRCKADVVQLVMAGEKGPARSIDNRCWARTGHTVTQVSSTLSLSLQVRHAQFLML